tara:strand:- start:1030 stop:1347 length:318 start_codon:yes stop_codon:yes gene_type:complete
MPSNISISGGSSFADYFEDGAVSSPTSSTSAAGVIIDLSGKGVARIGTTGDAVIDMEIDGKAISGAALTSLVTQNPYGDRFAFEKSIKVTRVNASASSITWSVLL